MADSTIETIIYNLPSPSISACCRGQWDRTVDEIQVSFRHTAELPWLLPGVMPTNRDVHFVMMVMASFCASRIMSQEVYWDQASVLAQVGLLDWRFAPRAI